MLIPHYVYDPLQNYTYVFLSIWASQNACNPGREAQIPARVRGSRSSSSSGFVDVWAFNVYVFEKLRPDFCFIDEARKGQKRLGESEPAGGTGPSQTEVVALAIAQTAISSTALRSSHSWPRLKTLQALIYIYQQEHCSC